MVLLFGSFNHNGAAVEVNGGAVSVLTEPKLRAVAHFNCRAITQPDVGVGILSSANAIAFLQSLAYGKRRAASVCDLVNLSIRREHGCFQLPAKRRIPLDEWQS